MSNILEAKLDGGKIIKGFILSVPVMTMMATTLASGFFGKYLGARLTMGIGLFIASTTLTSIPFIYELIIFWPVIALVGVGTGMVLPPLDTISTAVTKREYRGILTTVYGSSRSLGAALAPYTFALLMEAGHRMTFFPVASGAALVGLIIILFLHDEEILPQNLLADGEISKLDKQQ